MSSASIVSGSHTCEARRIRSWYQWSRPSMHSSMKGLWRRCTMMTCSTERVIPERLVGDALQRDHLAAAVAAVRRDEEARLLIVDTIAQRLGAEPSEDHAVHGPDARARQHGNRELGDERQVDRDTIALRDPERLQDVGERRDLAIEIEVGQRAVLARLAFPDDGRLVAPWSARVAIDAVHARVQLPVGEPARVRRFPVEHLRERALPFELAGEACPEAFGVTRRFVVHRRVPHDRGGREGRRRVEMPVFAQQRVDLCVVGVWR